MKKIVLTLIAAALTLGGSTAFATPQQDKMKSCNAEAKTKDLKGDDRKGFMKGCLSGGMGDAKADAKTAPQAVPNAQCEDKAVGKNGKKLAGAAKSAFMKKCEADANMAK
jgi:hypothetical protein